MPISMDDIDMLFTYHPPNEDQKDAYERIRNQAKLMALTILANTLPCPDQTVAIRKLREVVMTANAAIALGGQF